MHLTGESIIMEEDERTSKRKHRGAMLTIGMQTHTIPLCCQMVLNVPQINFMQTFAIDFLL